MKRVMYDDTPYVRDLVLIGGGHSHVQVLRRFGMFPERGIRITMIAREPHSPYSGMLPGYIAGDYSWEEIHVDLLKLCNFANARLIAEEVSHVEPDRKAIDIEGRPSVRYDVLSINTGGAPGIHFADSVLVTPVKPIGRFIPAWNRIVEKAGKQGILKLVIVGGGPGSVEVALAIREKHGDAFNIELVTAGEELLPEHNRFVRKSVARELMRHNVLLRFNFRATNIVEGALVAEDGTTVHADSVLWVAGVEAPSWVADSGFAVDDHGFLRVSKQLQSISHEDVFAAGDIASLDGQPRPKSGVYAVREGPVLSYNLRAQLIGGKLKTFNAQKKALALLRLPNNRAIVSKGFVVSEGRFAAVWKNYIDRKFMSRFQELPRMKIKELSLPESMAIDQPTVMRCGGCGSKLGADLLERVLRRLEIETDDSVLLGVGDDAAIVDLRNTTIVTSCDGFRALISDPYQFGRISANHALNDLYAMGSTPKIALVIATIPLMSQALMEEELYQAMSGAISVLNEAQVQLVGGHSAEGKEFSLAFAVTGTLGQDALLKSSMKTGQVLILTKALGTGVVLAGAMRGSTAARDVLDAITTMDQSNARAAQIFLEYGATAMTDVTGFGLLGHVSELCRRSNQGVEISSHEIPLLPGARDAINRGVRSSLHENNALALEDFDISSKVNDVTCVAMVDPQTCGGLLASLDARLAESCTQTLREAGYTQACVIGSVSGVTQSTIT